MIEQRVDHDAKGQGCEAWISHEWNLPVCCGGLAHTTSNDSRDVFIDNMEITSSGSLGGTSLCNVFDDEKRSARVCRPLEGDERSQSSPLDQSNGTRSIDMLNRYVINVCYYIAKVYLPQYLLCVLSKATLYYIIYL